MGKEKPHDAPVERRGGRRCRRLHVRVVGEPAAPALEAFAEGIILPLIMAERAKQAPHLQVVPPGGERAEYLAEVQAARERDRQASIREELKAFATRCLEPARIDFERSTGRHRALLLGHAMRFCFLDSLPVPDWVRDAWERAFVPLWGMKVGSFDEALGVKAITPRRLAQHRGRANRYVVEFPKVFAELYRKALANDRPFDWDELQKRIGGNVQDLKNFYYASPWKVAYPLKRTRAGKRSSSGKPRKKSD